MKKSISKLLCYNIIHENEPVHLSLLFMAGLTIRQNNSRKTSEKTYGFNIIRRRSTSFSITLLMLLNCLNYSIILSKHCDASMCIKRVKSTHPLYLMFFTDFNGPSRKQPDRLYFQLSSFFLLNYNFSNVARSICIFIKWLWRRINIIHPLSFLFTSATQDIQKPSFELYFFSSQLFI